MSVGSALSRRFSEVVGVALFASALLWLATTELLTLVVRPQRAPRGGGAMREAAR